jgi:hypothetical protein
MLKNKYERRKKEERTTRNVVLKVDHSSGGL